MPLAPSLSVVAPEVTGYKVVETVEHGTSICLVGEVARVLVYNPKYHSLLPSGSSGDRLCKDIQDGRSPFFRIT